MALQQCFKKNTALIKPGNSFNAPECIRNMTQYYANLNDVTRYGHVEDCEFRNYNSVNILFFKL